MPAVAIPRGTGLSVIDDAESPRRSVPYLVTGAIEEAEAIVAVGSVAPPFIGPLVRQSIQVDELGNKQWDASVGYGKREKKQTGDSTYSFDTGGGTQRRNHSLQTRARYAPPGKTAPDCRGLIGVTKDHVEGVDVVVPVYNWTETHYLADSIVNDAYRSDVYLCTGGVNASTFRGFASGEVLFQGASGAKRGKEDWEVSFKFSASPNASDLTVGEITGISKFGWDYLWVLYQDTDDENVLVKKPIGVYVEEVFFARNLALLGIGS